MELFWCSLIRLPSHPTFAKESNFCQAMLSSFTHIDKPRTLAAKKRKPGDSSNYYSLGLLLLRKEQVSRREFYSVNTLRKLFNLACFTALQTHLTNGICSTAGGQSNLCPIRPAAFMMGSPEAFTVVSSAEDLRHAARVGDADEASQILKRYEGEENEIAKFLPAVVAAADGLSGNRALHLCAANGHLDILEMLLSHGADIDATNQAGSTALHYASLNGRFEIVKKLIERGAQPVFENKYGKTALDEARAARQTESAEFLIAHVENTGAAPDLETEEAGDKNKG